jgi:nucleoside-diphosphate-sugar epimerase
VYPVSLQTRQNSKLLHEGFQSARNPTWLLPDELYGFAKLAGEFMAQKAADKHGLSTLVIRPFTGYGPGQSMDYPVPSILRRALLQEDPLTVWGSGDQRRDYVYVTDIVGATMARVEAGVEGVEVMNISSGYGVPIQDLAASAAKLVGYEPQIVADPSKPEGVFARCRRA